MKLKDLSGKRFGNLVVQNKFKKDKRIKWLCKCDCGKELYVLSYNLLSGNTISCGCKSSRKIKNTRKISKTKIYRVWSNMIQRCTNKNVSNYKRYGGRGIDVCLEWKNNSESFYDWAISNGYKDGLQIDRIDNNKGYYPENCRWVDIKQQARNKRKQKLLTYNGTTKPFFLWIDELKLNRYRVLQRLKLGWSIKDAFEKPVLCDIKKGENKC